MIKFNVKSINRVNLINSIKIYGCFIGLSLYGVIGALLLHDSHTWLANLVNHTIAFKYLAYSLQSLWLIGLFAIHQQISQTKTKPFFKVGLSLGIGYFTYGLHWLLIAMHQYGHLHIGLASVALLIFAACNALFYGFAFKAAKQTWQLIASLTLLELARNYVLTGFPALSPVYHLSNYSDSLPIYALLFKTVGMYGVQFIYLALLYAIYKVCFIFIKIKPTFNQKIAYSNLLIFLIGLHSPIFNQALPKPINTEQKFINIALLQGNVSQDVKFVQNMQFYSLNVYLDLIKQVKDLEKLKQAQIIDLIITPETAIPFFKEDIPQEFFTQASHLLGKTPLVFGAVDSALKTKPSQTTEFGYLNSLFLLKESRLSNIYQKQHLVPIGEFMPYGLAWFVKLMEIPLVELVPGGKVQKPLILNKDGQTLALSFNICYELFFSDELAHVEQVSNAQAIINSTNLAWFGKKTALYQFLEIAKVRSLELNKPLLMVNNEGITAGINALGQINAQLPIAKPGYLIINVPIQQNLKPSFYSQYVQTILISLALICMALLIATRRFFKKI